MNSLRHNLFLATFIATFFASVANVVAGDPAGPNLGNIYFFAPLHLTGDLIGLTAMILMIVAIRIFWRAWRNSTGNKRPILATVLFSVGYAAFTYMLVDLFHHCS